MLKMVDLDDLAQIKKYDSKDMAGSIVFLKDQVKSAWEESKELEITPEYKNVKNIVLAGMGGDTLGPHLIRSVFNVSLPLQIVSDYLLPSFVDENTLVIVSSYSGTTEEVLSVLEDSLKRRAKIIGIGSGSKLIENLKSASLPYYQFDPKYNPCGQPRVGLGYLIGGLLGFLSQLGFISFSDQDMEKTISIINDANKRFILDCKLEQNPAKKTASNLLGKTPIVVSAEFLAGNAHIFANQINENAKTFSAYFLLPDINHHLLEGIRFPANLGEKIKFAFLETALYSEKIKTRLRITKEVLAKTGIDSVSYSLESDDKVQTAFEALTFSSWTSFYLAVANEIDPTPIPNVEYFKDQLAKRPG